MRRLLARLAVLGAFAVSVSACGNNGSSLPFAGIPNEAGGTSGTIQSGSTGSSLLRFINGSPDYATVDICVDNQPFGGGAGAGASTAYGKAAAPTSNSGTGLYTISAGIGHVLTVWASTGVANSGLECATAPGPYFNTPAIATTVITPANNTRLTAVLGGRVANGTLGLYVFNEPTFPTAPTNSLAWPHNAAPNFGLAGFTYTFNGVTTTFSGNGANLAPATKSSATAASVNPFGNGTLLPGVPTNFGVGKGTPTPPVVPLVTTPAPAPSGTQPYEVEVYAIDATGANPVNIVAVTEPLTLLGF